MVDEGKNFTDAMEHKGRTSHPAGLRLYNQKYYTVRYDEEEHLLYLKKVYNSLNRNTEELALQPLSTIILSELSISRTKWRMEFLKIQESSIRE